jgi:hypothetical protein
VRRFRLIVTHPARGPFAWASGRTYEHMAPELTLDHIMSPEEAATWHSRAAPARETDIFGHQA